MKTLLLTCITIVLMSCTRDTEDQPRSASVTPPVFITIDNIAFNTAYDWNEQFNEYCGYEIRVNGQTRYMADDMSNQTFSHDPNWTVEASELEVYLYDIDGGIWINRDTFYFDLTAVDTTYVSVFRHGGACEMYLSY